MPFAADTEAPGRHSYEIDRCKELSAVLSRVGDRWTMLVVIVLANGPMRFSELKRAIGGVTQRMLTLTLRGLERDGVVTRTVTPTRPPRVDYELTSLGRSLRGPIEALGQWSFENLDVIHRSREAYDAAATAED